MAPRAPIDVPELLRMLRETIEAAPNPRVVDGPPAYWQWYDGPRAVALAKLDTVNV